MRTYLEPVEIQKMEEEATTMRDRLLLKILYRLGCRVSEALGIKVEDIDFVSKTITIKHLKTRLKVTCSGCGSRLGKSHFYCPRCGISVKETIRYEQNHLKQRILPIDESTSKMLHGYIRRGGPVEKDGKRLIFGINRHRAWQIVRECASRAGLPNLVNPETAKIHGVSPHRLRDAFAVHAVKADDSGNGLRLLQEHLGHASFNTTARYRKISGEEHRQWYESLWNDKGE